MKSNKIVLVTTAATLALVLAGCGVSTSTSSNSSSSNNSSSNSSSSTPTPVVEKLNEGMSMGVGTVVDFGRGKLNVTIASGLFDASGKVVKFAVDAYNVPLVGISSANAAAETRPTELVLKAGDKTIVNGEVNSKMELGAAYGMGGSNPLKYWSAEAGALGKYFEGKKWNDFKSDICMVKEGCGEAAYGKLKSQYPADGLVAKTTISMNNTSYDSLYPAIKQAFEYRMPIGVLSGTGSASDIKLGLSGKVSLSGTQVDVNVASIATDGSKKIIGSSFDTVQIPLSLRNEVDGTVAIVDSKSWWDLNPAKVQVVKGLTNEDKVFGQDRVRSKVELKYDYGMTGAAILAGNKEWFEQFDHFQKWTVGKTMQDVVKAKYFVKDSSHQYVPADAGLIGKFTMTVKEEVTTLNKAYKNATGEVVNMDDMKNDASKPSEYVK